MRFISTMLLMATFSIAFGQTSFNFENQEMLPGTKSNFLIPVSDGDSESFIPVTVFHGMEDGPVLGITAGVHGYEYAPILASKELTRQLDPRNLKGTIILVQIANLGSFLGRSPYTNPLDNKNLNRSFPGDKDGTITERIAYLIGEKVIARSDYFIDVHSGDAPEDLMAYSAYYHHDSKSEISTLGKGLATHMGYDHVVIFNTTEKDYMKEGKPSLYCSAEAFKRDIPAVDIECGRLGMVEADHVDKIVDGFWSALRHLQMLDGEPVVTSGIRFIEERSYQESVNNGLFYNLKSSGEYVNQGMKLGYTTDFFGETIEEFYAESSGVLLYILATPPVNTGETVAAIGKIDAP